MVSNRLTLKKAIKDGRLRDFIRQEEDRGAGPADKAEVDEVLERLIKQPQSEDQTSHSPSRDGSREK